MNLSPTRRYGLELEGSRKINDRLELGANYTYAIARFVEGTYASVNVVGKDIPLVPKNTLTVSGSYLVMPQTRLNAAVNYVGQQRFDNDQANTFNQKMPAYTTVDLKLVQQKKNWSWSAAVYNLLNEKYFTYAIRSTTQGVYNAYPMKERYALFSVQYDLK
jgi:iron complex outermembrane receptor protein